MNWPGRGAEREAAEAAAAVASTEVRDRARRTGEVLRQTRIERGITLYDVEQDIRINRAYLAALEEAKFELLPAPVYARGFMRSYARYLGLDPDEALRAVPRDLPRPTELDPMPGLRRAMPSTLPSLPAMPNLPPPVLIGFGVAGILIVALAFFVLGVRGVFSTGSGDATPTPTATAPAQSTGEAPNLVGATREVATQTLSRAGLSPLIFESENAAPAGVVFRQSPGAGSPVRQGDVITLFISRGVGGGTATSSPTPSPTPTATPAR